MPVADLVFQTSGSEGAGDFILTHVTGFRGFSEAFGTGSENAFFYFIRHTAQNEYEYGTGYIDDLTGALVRNAVIGSSAGGTKVDFSAGFKDVVNDLPAAFQKGFITGGISFHIESAENKTVTLDESAPYAYDIESLTAVTSAGTVDVSVQIDGTGVTGINTEEIGSTQTILTATAGNAVPAGGRVTLILMNSIGAENLAGTLKLRRT